NSRVSCVRLGRERGMSDMTRNGDRKLRRTASSVGQVLAILIAACSTAHGQNWLTPLENFAPVQSSLRLQRRADLEKPFTVTGECGTFVGRQDGRFEAWLFPVKI